MYFKYFQSKTLIEKILTNRKFTFHCFFLFIIFLSLIACDLKFKDKSPNQDEFVFEEETKVKCISKTTPYFEAFLRGEPEGAKVKEFWNCSALAMSSFKIRIKGTHEGFYSAKAMGLFLEKYFLDDMVITGTLIEELMRLKQVFFGGSIKEFSIDELDQLVVMFNKMGVLTEELFPYMVLYTGKWKPKSDYLSEDDVQYFEKGSLALDKFVVQLGKWVKSDGISYPIDNFLIFLKEFDKMMKYTVDFSSPIEKLYPILKKLKLVLASGNSDLITAEEWQNFLTLGSKGYMIYLRWDLFLSERKTNLTEQIWIATRILDDSFVLVKELLTDKINAQISNEDLYETLMRFHDIYPNFVVSRKSVDQLMLIKKSLLGSSAEYWEYNDFEKIRIKVEMARNMVLKLLPYTELFNDNWSEKGSNSKISQKFIKQAFTSLFMLKENFISLWAEPYDWSNVSIFLDELLVLYPEKLDFRLKWQTYFPVFLSAKKILTADESALVGANQWQKLFDPAFKLLEIYVMQKYFPNEDIFLSKASLEYWADLFQSVFTELEASTKSRPDGNIPVLEVENLVGVLVDAKLIEVSRDNLQSFLNNLMQLKKALLNSSSDYWTAEDFTKARVKLTNIKDLLITLLPYQQVYFGEFQYKPLEINEATQYVNKAFNVLSQAVPNYISLWESPLEMNVFTLVLSDLEKLLKDNNKIKELQSIWIRYFPVMLAAKKLLIGDASSIIDSTDLQLFLGPGVNLFKISTLQKYFPNTEKGFLTKKNINYWSEMVSSIFEEMESALKSKPSARVKVADIEFLLRGLDEAGLTSVSVNLSKSLLYHVMEIKKSILGTSGDFWTAQDFVQMRAEIFFIRSLLNQLLPYLDIIKGQWYPKYNEPRQAKKHLQEMFGVFYVKANGFIKLWKKPFDWDLIPSMLEDFSKVLPGDNELVEFSSAWKLYFPVVVAAKQIITGSSSTSLDKKDWSLFYQPAFDSYELYLNYYYFTSKENFLEKDGFESWYHFLNSVIYKLYPISQARGQIPIVDFENLLLVLEKNNLVVLKINNKIISKYGPLLLTRYLTDPRYRKSSSFYKGINSKHLDYISTKWMCWGEAQRFIFTILENVKNRDLKLSELHTRVNYIADQYKKQNAFTLSVMQMKNILLSPQNLFLPANLFLEISSPKKMNITLNESSFVIMNLVRAMVDLAFNGYLPKDKNFMSGIEEQEFKTFLNELTPVLKEMGWLKKAKDTFAEARFLEGNLFTPSADGDEVLSYQEGVELVTMLISGDSRSKKMIKVTEEACPVRGLDITDVSCFRNILYENRAAFYASMPAWLWFLDGLSRAEMDGFASYLEQGAEVEVSHGELYIPDLLLLANISQYIEVIFTRFNNNDDGVLNTDEVMRAYPVFKQLLTKLSKLGSPSQVRALFAYILKYGRAPERSLAGLIEFKLWANSPADWNLSVDRVQLAKIFNFIQNEKSKQKMELDKH